MIGIIVLCGNGNSIAVLISPRRRGANVSNYKRLAYLVLNLSLTRTHFQYWLEDGDVEGAARFKGRQEDPGSLEGGACLCAPWSLGKHTGGVGMDALE